MRGEQAPQETRGYGGLLRAAPWWDEFTLPDLRGVRGEDARLEDLLHGLATAFGVAGSAPESQHSSSLERAALAAAVLARCGVEAQGWYCAHALLDAESTAAQLGGGHALLDEAWERDAVVLWLPAGYVFDPLAPGDLAPPKLGGELAKRTVQVGPLWVRGESADTPPPLLGGLLADQLTCYAPREDPPPGAPERERGWKRAQEDRVGVRMMCWLTARALSEAAAG